MQLNHVLLRSRDSSAMTAFFVDVLDLSPGPRPPFAFDGAWIYAGSRALIHLVDANPADAEQAEYLGSSAGANGTGIVDHLAFSGDDYSGLIARLSKLEYTYFERTVPESGEHQVFVEGPEGLKIEVVFDENRDSLNR